MLDIIQKPVPNFEKGRKNFKPEIVVIHIGEGNRNAIYSEFLNNEKSSHYCVNNDNTIWQFVKEEDTAWGQGIINNPTSSLVKEFLKKYPNDKLNRICIAIENEGYGNFDISEGQYRLNAELVKDICEWHNIPIDRQHIIPHKEINADKTCPGKINVDKIISLIMELKQEKELLKELEEQKKIKLMEKQVGLLEQLKNALIKLLELLGIRK